MREHHEPAPTLTTVLGPLAPDDAGITDAHQHVWIEPSGAAGPGLPVLNDRAVAAAGLAAYRDAGGGALLDCQPGGCGRNALMLAELSRRNRVPVIACTGFHLRKYYKADYWLWSASAEKAACHFVTELQEGAVESAAEGAAESRAGKLVLAGFIKVACTADLDDMPAHLLAAAAEASRVTGAAILVHTEQGTAAEEIVRQFTGLGLSSGRLVLCHMDKRPDAGLHRELADAGVLLEYDTFFRPKYDPERNAWPLLERMLADGYGRSIALGTDLADIESWRRPGPAGLPLELLPRVRSLGCSEEAAAALTGKNIVMRLARVMGLLST